jgi:hypothetical protein
MSYKKSILMTGAALGMGFSNLDSFSKRDVWYWLLIN